MTSPSGPSAVGQTAGGEAVTTVPGGGTASTASTASTAGSARTGVAAATASNVIGTGAQAPAGQPDADAGPERHYDRGPVWAMVLPPLVALVLSLWDITTPSFWRDEAATIAADKRPFGDMIRMLGHVDAVHGAYYIMMWPLLHLFGAGEFIMRLPSALAAGVIAAFVAAIGRRVVSPWAGLATGLLFAVLPVASR